MTSENTKRETAVLMNAVLPVAERMLREYGEFYPYGGYLKSNGEIVHVGAMDTATDHPKTTDVLGILRNSLSKLAKSGECRATAIVIDVRIKLPKTKLRGDAIQICLDHKGGYSKEVFVPYRISSDGSITFGEIFASEGRHETFDKE